MAKRVIIFLLLATIGCNASLTAVKRGLMVQSVTNVADLTSSNTNDFQFVSGTVPVLPVGATTNAMPLGWSAWYQQQAPQVLAWTNLVKSNYYQAGFWFHLHTFSMNGTVTNAAGSGFTTQIIGLVNSANQNFSKIGVDGIGQLWQINNGTATNFGNPLALNTWYYMSVGWLITNTFALDCSINLGTLGSPLTNLITRIHASNPGDITSVQFGPVSGFTWSGRMTGMSVDLMSGGFSDQAIPADMIAPPSGRSTYYFDPVNGADLNSGHYSTNAWATALKLSKMIQYGGAMGNASMWTSLPGVVGADAWNAGVMAGTITPTGDAIMLNTDSGDMRSTNAIYFATGNPGVELGNYGTKLAQIVPYKLLSGFTQPNAGTYPHVWQAAHTVLGAIMYEDRKWMNNPTNASQTNSYATLESLPGSFHSDGTNIAFHPFGDTDPTSDGKVYEATTTQYQNGVVNQSGAMLNNYGNGNYVHGLALWGNIIRNQTNGDCNPSYTVSENSSGPSAYGNLDLKYAGKHCYGAIGGPSNLYRLFFGSLSQQGAPWSNHFGLVDFNQTVEFPSSDTNGQRSVYYIAVDSSIDSLIGSTNGTYGTGGFYNHTSTEGYDNAYGALNYNTCTGFVSMINLIGQPNTVIVSNSVCSYINAGTNTILVSRCNTGPIYGSKGGTVTDTISTRSGLLQDFNSLGAWNFRNCTFDASQATYTVIRGLIHSINGTNTIGVSNCVVRLSDTSTNVVFWNYSNGDTLNFDYNVFKLGGQSAINASNTTFIAQSTWTGAGEDAHSFFGDPCLSANYRPYAKTPTWVYGFEVGPSLDYSGKLFQSRRTAGAYEYIVPNAQFLFGHR